MEKIKFILSNLDNVSYDSCTTIDPDILKIKFLCRYNIHNIINLNISVNINPFNDDYECLNRLGYVDIHTFTLSNRHIHLIENLDINYEEFRAICERYDNILLYYIDAIIYDITNMNIGLDDNDLKKVLLSSDIISDKNNIVNVKYIEKQHEFKHSISLLLVDEHNKSYLLSLAIDEATEEYLQTSKDFFAGYFILQTSFDKQFIVSSNTNCNIIFVLNRSMLQVAVLE